MITKSILFDLLLWLAPSFCFLYIYLKIFDAPTSALLPHLASVISVYLGLMGIRLINWKISSLKFALPHSHIAAALLLTPPLLLLLWYAVTIIGLIYWGRVVTWPLLNSYLKQISYFSKTLDLPTGTIPSLTLIALLLASGIFALRKKIQTLDLSHTAHSHLSSSSLLVISFLSICTAALQLTALRTNESRNQEPISIAFFNGSTTKIQSHDFTPSPLLDANEKKIRDTYSPSKTSHSKNLILIIVDALRADHMGIYGYERQTTPHLTELSKKFETFIIKNTTSTCAESFCGLSALISSRNLNHIPSNPISLQETLKAHGYSINLILSGDHTNFYGIRDIYGPVDSYFDATLQAARYINDDSTIIDQLNKIPPHPKNKPAMFQFHLMSTHGLGLRHEENKIYTPYTNYYKWPPRQERIAPNENEASRAINHYDNGVKQADKIISEIIYTLKNKGYLEEALVVITADHGEMLGEKKLFGHQHTVDEAVLRIPLIFQRQGYKGVEIPSRPASSQIDIAPTILRELDINQPASWQGIALQSSTKPRYTHFQQHPNRGIYITENNKKTFKYYINMTTYEEHVYKIEEDPLETKNIANTTPDSDLKSWRQETLK